MSKQSNLIYALKDGQITSIADVESGLKCGCVCPACGEPLVAKKGSKMMHHFAHRAGTNCEYGYRTSLHLAAKDILSKAKKMVIPAVILRFPDSYKEETISKEMEISLDHVELEQRFDNVIPDVVAYSGDKYFFIEIFVTHQVDESKLSKLQNNNISTLEIDLSKLDRMIPLEELKEILLQSNKAKKWIYNAVASKWLSRFKKVADKKRIVEHGYALHVYDCPIKMRTWRGRTYANIIDDCFYCEYCISHTDGYILCSGRQRISHIKDFNVSMETRLKESEARRKGLQDLLVAWGADD